MMRSGRVRLLFSLVAVSVLLAWGGLRSLAARRLTAALNQAKAEMAAGRYSTARQLLAAQASMGAGEGEVDYQLGLCELYRGHPEAAMAAWERVSPTARFGARAVLQRSMLLIESGRFSPAEALLQSALDRPPGPDTTGLLRAYELLCQLEGRTEDARRLVVRSWLSSETPAAVVQQLYRLDTSPWPLEMISRALAKADPDDDRVWLARANQATRTGRFAEASGWLDSCIRKRQDDPVVWQALLELAQGKGDPEMAWKALEHLTAAQFSAVGELRLRAWLSGLEQRSAPERSALETLVELEPGDTAALDRLSVLASDAGDHARVIVFRSKMAEMTSVKERYRSLLRGESAGDPAELARLAESLGRKAEARGWAMIRDHQTQPRQPLAETSVPWRPDHASRSRDESMAVALADLRPRQGPPPAAITPPVCPRFLDFAQSAGLKFVQENGQTPRKLLPETMSGGVGLLDYDGDGWLDVYAVQGGTLVPNPVDRLGDRLFRNRRNGSFEDVTEQAGLGRLGAAYGHGVAVGDYDNDGRCDVFVTRWRSYLLLHNRGDGTFEEVTSSAGLGGDRDWPTSAAWADLDGDGDLDLYVCHYVQFDTAKPMLCPNFQAKVKEYCSPREFASLPDHVFRNDHGRFVDVSSSAGIVDSHGRGLGILAVDLDDDNRIDLYVANDMSANALYQNHGGFHFEEIGAAAGAAANSSGFYQSGMGLACGDLDGDGRPDLAVTNYFGESTTVFQNLGHFFFADQTRAVGLAAPTRYLLGFGICFLDANNDGQLDMISTNGHVSDFRPSFPWKMPTQLLLGSPGGRLVEACKQAGGPLEDVHLGRGLAAGDLDNDGLIDVVIMAQNEPLVCLHNCTETAAHWVTISLEGVASNRDGVGARVEILAGGRRQVAQRTGGGSYQSSGDPRIHFGLCPATRIEQLEVRWPAGRVDRYRSLAVDTGLLLREGHTKVTPIPGWTRTGGR